MWQSSSFLMPGFVEKPMNRVSLNKHEAEWFSRNVFKMTQLLEVSARKDAGVLGRATYKTLKSMLPIAEKATKTESEQVDVMLTRKQKLILRDLIGSVNKTLIEKVIPEYKRRGESHSGYLLNAEKKAEALKIFERKLK